MRDPNERMQQTVYPVKSHPNPNGAPVESGWATDIDRVIEKGYRFLDATYTPGGVLFRGMSSGLTAALAAGRCGGFIDDGPLCELERDLGVLFCSQDLSDAVAVSRIWETPDSVVLVFSSDLFVREWAARRAAVLGFAEAGILFRYPFLLRPLELHELTFIVRPAATQSLPPACKQITLPRQAAGNRRECEAAIETMLRESGNAAAKVRFGVEYPSR
jgi:hypothetical protein